MNDGRDSDVLLESLYPHGRSQDQERRACAERERFLEIVTETVNEHGQAVSALVDIVTEGRSCRKASSLRDQIARAGSKVQAAWKAYYWHVQQHGC
jgi:hypothetical protein